MSFLPRSAADRRFDTWHRTKGGLAPYTHLFEGVIFALMKRSDCRLCTSKLFVAWSKKAAAAPGFLMGEEVVPQRLRNNAMSIDAIASRSSGHGRGYLGASIQAGATTEFYAFRQAVVELGVGTGQDELTEVSRTQRAEGTTLRRGIVPLGNQSH